MSTRETLIERFKRQPKDFTWEELVRLFGVFGFAVDNKGKTSGSRALFVNGSKAYFVHKPHPTNIVKEALMKHVLGYLKSNDFIS